MEHLDEGTAHAWLDGALGQDESAAIEQHVASCAACAAIVAEARGFIAASSRILTSLDGVPSQVIPASAATSSDAFAALRARKAAAPAARRRTWWRDPRLAAAAAIVVAVGSFAVVSRTGRERAQGGFADAAAEPRAASSPADSISVPAAAPAPPASAPLNAPREAEPAASATRNEAKRSADLATSRTLEQAAQQPVVAKAAGKEERDRKVDQLAGAAPPPAAVAEAAKRTEVTTAMAADRVPNTAGQRAQLQDRRAQAPEAARLDGTIGDVAAPLAGCYAIHFVAVGGGPMTIAAIRMPTRIRLDTARVAGTNERVVHDVSPTDQRVPGKYRWRSLGASSFELRAIRDGNVVTFPAVIGEDVSASQGLARPMPAGAAVRLLATKEPCGSR